MEHRLNTDNAWVETQAINYHDDFNLVFPKIDVEAVRDQATTAKWMPVSKAMGVSATNLDLIARVRSST